MATLNAIVAVERALWKDESGCEFFFKTGT